MSKFHFHRLFTATYGRTRPTHLADAGSNGPQDLLRATNLTVTEVCFAVGYSSLGSFSSRFRQIVGETPSAYQKRYGCDAPRIPAATSSCAAVIERKSASREKRIDGVPVVA